MACDHVQTGRLASVQNVVLFVGSPHFQGPCPKPWCTSCNCLQARTQANTQLTVVSDATPTYDLVSREAMLTAVRDSLILRVLVGVPVVHRAAHTHTHIASPKQRAANKATTSCRHSSLWL